VQGEEAAAKSVQGEEAAAKSVQGEEAAAQAGEGGVGTAIDKAGRAKRLAPRESTSQRICKLPMTTSQLSTSQQEPGTAVFSVPMPQMCTPHAVRAARIRAGSLGQP
jgi:hypothetical protein